jgi:hypothetical protein
MRVANRFDQMIGRKDLMDGFVAEILATQGEGLAKSTVGGNDRRIPTQHQQWNWKRCNHFLVVAALALDQR